MMNPGLIRFLKSAYRQEPITSFIVIVGAVDAALGGIDHSVSLFSFGLVLVTGALALRWWQLQRNQPLDLERVPEHYLPPASSHQPLPLLMTSKKYPPQ